jgi:hypothetical protein
MRGLCGDDECVTSWVIPGSELAWRLATAFAAVLPEVVSKRFVGGGVVVERALLTADEHFGIVQPLQVVTQRRRGEINVALDFTRGTAALSDLHHKPQNCEAHRMAKRSELICAVANF